MNQVTQAQNLCYVLHTGAKNVKKCALYAPYSLAYIGTFWRYFSERQLSPTGGDARTRTTLYGDRQSHSKRSLPVSGLMDQILMATQPPTRKRWSLARRQSTEPTVKLFSKSH
jgi:hypothetical protein